jgi:hypothetical protein
MQTREQRKEILRLTRIRSAKNLRKVSYLQSMLHRAYTILHMAGII